MTVVYSGIGSMLKVYNKAKSDKKFIIAWSPKSGCTTVCKIFFDYMGILEEYIKEYPWIHNARPKFYKTYGLVNQDLLLSNEYIKLKFVRNPYSRAVSSYLHVMKSKLKDRLFNGLDMSFYEFLTNINSSQYTEDVHYALQISRIEDIHRKIFNHIIKLENLEKELAKIQDIYGIELKYKFPSTHHTIKDNSILLDIAYVKYSKIKTIPNYKSFYQHTAIQELVNTIYRKDIDIYQYTFNDFLHEQEKLKDNA